MSRSPIRLSFLLLWVMILLSVGVQAQQPSAADVLANIRKAYDIQRYDLAIQGAQYYLATYPTKPECETAAAILVMGYLKQGQYAQACEAGDLFVKRYPTSTQLPDVYLTLYEATLRQAPERAEGLFDEIGVRWPKSETTWRALERWFAVTTARKPEVALATVLDLVAKEAKVLPDNALLRAKLMRLEALARTQPAQYYSEAQVLVVEYKDAPDLETFAPVVDLAERLYPVLVEAGQLDAVTAVHTQVQATLARLAATTRGQQAATAYAQALTKVALLVGQTVQGYPADQAKTAVEFARGLYAPLNTARLGPQAEWMHTTIQAACTRWKNTGWANADTVAYYDAQPLRYTPEELMGYAKTLTAQGPQLTTAPECQTYAELACRLYGPLFNQGQQAVAIALHTAVQQAVLNYPALTLQRSADIRAYIQALNALLAAQLPKAGTATASQEALQTLCLDAWQQHPSEAIDAACAFVRERLLRDPQVSDWVAPFHTLVMRLPPTHPAKCGALLLLGQFAQAQAGFVELADQDATALMQTAIAAYRQVVESYGTQVAAIQARTNLYALYMTLERSSDLEALLAKAADDSTLVPALQWLGTYHLRSAQGQVAIAEQCFTRLLKLAPSHVQAAAWQFALGRCLEARGNLTEACAAYQRVFDTYPDSSCVVAAMWKLEQLGGRQ